MNLQTRRGRGTPLAPGPADEAARARARALSAPPRDFRGALSSVQQAAPRRSYSSHSGRVCVGSQ
eukprot:scaffold133385_cov70-Phaeocystis_antarctica.AAC.1